MTTVYKEFDILNKQKPIWLRNKEDIITEEYQAFYKSLTNDWDDYMYVEQFKVEGQIEFKSILFIPKRAQNENVSSNKKLNNIKLYVRRIFITDDCTELLPEYLSFVKGIVDSDDLPLNISREILQQNKILKIVKKNLVKRCLQMFTEIAKDDSQYLSFYENFSKNIKFGICEDADNLTKLAKFLRFQTTKSGDNLESLDKYIERMKENQDSIYYITGGSLESISNSPFLEKLLVKKYEVIFMIDPIDEYVMQNLTEYGGKKFILITKERLELHDSEEEKNNFEKDKSDVEKLCGIIKEILSENIEKVIPTNRLSDSPCCLVTGQYSHSANMERIMKAQTLRTNNKSHYMINKNIMEINPTHPIIKSLCNRIDNGNKEVKDLIWLLYDTALLSSGFTHENPVKFSQRILRLVSLGLDLDEIVLDEVVLDEVVLNDVVVSNEESMEEVD